MSELEKKNPATKGMKELEEEYRKFLDERPKLPKLDAVSRAEDLLRRLRYSGVYIISPRYRDILAAWCRNIGAIIYDTTGNFPPMRISPLEMREALRAARENTDLIERVEDMVSVASYFPFEEKRALIAESFAVAYSISNEEDRDKALKAISSKPLSEEPFSAFAKASNVEQQTILNESHRQVYIGAPEPLPLLIPRQIPHPPLDFTGREDDLRELQIHFEKGVRIIGLLGMGGIGKATLAFALAERLKDHFPDGQLLVKMQGTSEEPLKPSEAMAQVIRSYDPNLHLPDSEAELANLYRSVLDGKSALLLLVDALDGSQVRTLLPPAKCSLIVTSRRRFKLPGMIIKDLDVLRLDEAVELLLKLASSGLSDDPSWQELALLCGCLPMALRAAGSYLANTLDLGPARYAEALKDERTRLERIGREGVELGVDASFNLSFRRLDLETQQTFLNASIFPADFDDRAEEIICQDEGHMHLSELVRWSLVDYQPQGPDYGRYKLHDLARLFASSRQPAESKAIVNERHAAYYKDLLSLADELYLQGGSNIQVALSLFDREWANIKAGQAWAELDRETNSSAAELCSNYPAAGAYLIDLRLHPQQKITWLETALSAARSLDDRNMEGVHLGNLGLTYAALGEARKAIEYYEQALAIDREIGDRRGEGSDLGNLGLAYVALGEARKAIEYYEQALAIDREIGDRRGVGNYLGNLGNANADLGYTRKAIEYYEQALAIAHEMGDKRNEGVQLGNLGIIYKNGGETRKAIGYYEQALAIAREIGDRRGVGALLGNLGLAYADMGETYTAIEFNTQNLVIAREIGDRRGEGNALDNLGSAFYNLDQMNKAIEYHEQALAIAREIGDRRGEGNALDNLGSAFYNLDQMNKAIGYYEKALVIAREIGDRKGEGNALGNLGSAFYNLDEMSKAIEYYEQALVIAREIGDGSGEGNALWGQAICHERTNNLDQAIDKAEEALKIFEQIKSPSASNIRDLLSKWGRKELRYRQLQGAQEE